MRAVRLHAANGRARLQLDEIDVPEPGPGEALLKVHACSINRIDLLARDGQTPAAIALPRILGTEVAGDVVAVGPDVESWVPGDRVVVDPVISCGDCAFCRNGQDNMCLRGNIYGLQTDGGYAEYALAPTRQLIHLPEAVSYQAAAAVTATGSTAWRMLMRRAQVRLGETVLVIAAGSGIGVMGVQIALLAGARVAATAGSDDKRVLAEQLGASIAVNHREPGWAGVVRKWTGGRGVDIAFEHVGAATWQGSLEALSRGGRLVTCGGHSGFDVSLDLWMLFVKGHTILGSFAGTRQDILDVLDLVASGRLRPIIHDVLPLERAADAQHLLDDRRAFGKVLLSPLA